MTKNRFLIGVVLFVASLAFMGCDSFFTTPMFGISPREYKPENIDVNKDNLDSWKKAAVGNPDLALALAQKIQGMGTTDPELLAAGASFAIQAADIGTTILSKVGTLNEILEDNGDERALTNLFEGIRKDFLDSNGKEAAGVLAAILVQDISGNNFTGYSPSPGDAAQAVMVLTLALDGDKPIDDVGPDLLKSYGITFTGKVPSASTTASPEAKVLVAYLNYIRTSPDADSNPITSAIQSAFGM
jgi:hypothetical protein